jgi:hypothetical protein
MPRKTIAIGLILSAALCSWTAAIAAVYFAEDPPEVAGSPFSATAKTESVTTFADGNKIVRGNTVHYYRDGHGRTRIERGEGPNRTIAINDPVAGIRYWVRPQNKVVIAYKGPAGQLLPPAMGGTQDDDLPPFGLLGFRMSIGATPTTEAASATTSLGQKSISGVTATGTRLVRNIPIGVLGNEKPITSTLERWVNPDLGVPVQITQTSTIGGRLTLNMDSIVRAEPDPALFVPPADYTRRDITLPLAAAARAPAVATAPASN